MNDTRYVVKRGDTLWDLAAKHLGDPLKWPEIYEHNNKPAVTALTRTRIATPDLIFIDQVIYIPASARALPSKPPAISGPPHLRQVPNPRPVPVAAPPGPRTTHGSGKGPAIPKIRSIPFKYNLPDLPAITVGGPGYIAKISLKGSITLQAKDSVNFVVVSNQGFELKAKREADLALGKLVSENKIGFNLKSGEVTFENGITTHADGQYAPQLTTTAGVSLKNGIPALKLSFKAPKIAGTVGEHVYLANDLKIEVAVTPQPSARPVPVRVPQPIPQTGPSVWTYLTTGALIIGAGALIVATIAEDVVTLGAGIADDVPSFAAASAMFVGGMGMLSTVQGAERIPIESYE